MLGRWVRNSKKLADELERKQVAKLIYSSTFSEVSEVANQFFRKQTESAAQSQFSSQLSLSLSLQLSLPFAAYAVRKQTIGELVIESDDHS